MNRVARCLPRPGLAYAVYPARSESSPWHWTRVAAACRGVLPWWAGGWRPGPAASLGVALEGQLAQARQRIAAGPDGAETRAVLLAELRHTLRSQGTNDSALGLALAVVADAAEQQLGQVPYLTQLIAAATMLRGCFAEMATGEGKTLAMGLAAAVAALAGTPVHVLTANDYLAGRDEAMLRPLFECLGLDSGCVLASTAAESRAETYRRAIVYSTAREVGFDYLRDHVRLAAERDPRRLRALALAARCDAGSTEAVQADEALVLPGLCLALLDEADSLLLDEANVPLLLARPASAMDAGLLHDAWSIAQLLQRGTDFALNAAWRRAWLTPAGRARVDATAPGRATHRLADAVQSALVALHLLERDRDYIVAQRQGQGTVVLVDEPTGRPAEGRRWQGDLTTFVQVKEHLPIEGGPVTVAKISYPRLFGRYLHLAGMSGTLANASVQLRVLYGARVQRVPLARPNCRRWLGRRLHLNTRLRWAAVLAAIGRETATGRPVLVGTECVAASAELSNHLQAAGISHQRLDAEQSADEADRIARAGHTGCVTVATNIAGRGTDIRLDAAARAAGGLHVIVTQLHRSRRIERQLIGRCARQGDPGSAEALLSLDDRLLDASWLAPLRAICALMARRGVVPALLAEPLVALAQRAQEWVDLLRRWQIAQGEQRQDDIAGFAGAAE